MAHSKCSVPKKIAITFALKNMDGEEYKRTFNNETSKNHTIHK
jgi:hypothetical protein